MTARHGYSRHHHRTLEYQQRLQQRLDRRAEDAEYANLLRSARLHQLLTTPDLYNGGSDEAAAAADPAEDSYARREGSTSGGGQDTSLGRPAPVTLPDRGPLFDLAADLARQEAGFSVKVPAHPLGDRLTLVRDSGAA